MDENVYKISRIIIPVLIFIIFSLMLINEDSSAMIVSFVLTIVSFILTFPGEKISKKLIKIGNKFNTNIKKKLYYLLLLPLTIIFISIMFGIITFSIISLFPSESTDLYADLGNFLLSLFITIVGVLTVLVPYLQTMMVITFRKFKIKKSC